MGHVAWGAREGCAYQAAEDAGGRNYGWKPMEGTGCGGGGTSGCPAGTPTCNSPGVTPPILEYTHSSGGCAVTGAYVYRGRSFPALAGTYFYADYCTGKIWGAHRDATGAWSTRLFAVRASGLTTLGEDAAGEVYVATEGGLLARGVEGDPASPTIVSLDTASRST